MHELPVSKLIAKHIPLVVICNLPDFASKDIVLRPKVDLELYTIIEGQQFHFTVIQLSTDLHWERAIIRRASQGWDYYCARIRLDSHFK